MKKVIFRAAKVMCLVTMAVCLQSASCGKDDEVDDSGTPNYTKYVDIKVTHCERVGGVLQVDLSMKNKGSNQVKVGLVDQKGSDNNGSNYDADIAAGNNMYSYRADMTIDGKGEQPFHIRVIDFDPSNTAKNAKLTMRISIEGVQLATPDVELTNISFSDNRIMAHGVQTNDTKLGYKVKSCILNNSDVELQFTVTNNTGMTLEDYGMGYMYGGEGTAYDDQGNRYGMSIRFGNGDWYHNAAANIQVGGSVQGAIRISDINRAANEVSVVIGASANNYRMSDNTVRFITIPIEK